MSELTTLKFVSERTKQQVFANDAGACAAAVHEVSRIDPILSQIVAGLLEPNQNTRMTPETVVAMLGNDLRAVAAQGQMLFSNATSMTYHAPMHPGVSHPVTGGPAILDY